MIPLIKKKQISFRDESVPMMIPTLLFSIGVNRRNRRSSRRKKNKKNKGGI
jgi:hypothetical protein